MLIATRLSAALFDATARYAVVEDHDGIRKCEGPDLNGASQDVAIEDMDVDSDGIRLDGDTTDAPPLP
jgi:hypothetical protein